MGCNESKVSTNIVTEKKVSKPKSQTPMRNGFWYNKATKSELYLIKGEKILCKGLASIDYPEEPNLACWYEGNISYGDFGPAHDEIVKATGIANYNCEIQMGIWKIQCVLNEEGTKHYSTGNILGIQT